MYATHLLEHSLSVSKVIQDVIFVSDAKLKAHDGRVVFHKNNCVTRNDLDFSLLKYEVEHQKAKSPLIDYNFPCVTGFVLDYMHLVCLGVMRRILNFLTDGPRLCKISIQQINCLSESMTPLNNQMPSEFAHQPRSLEYLKRWKATEFREILLYSGLIVLRRVIKKEVYTHFLCLSIVIRIMLSSNNKY